jgi:hypothetical protein
MRGANLPRMASRACFALLVALGALSACQRTGGTTQPAACTKAGQTCNLAPGLLGVCTEGASDKCDHEPCLVCMGQH